MTSLEAESKSVTFSLPDTLVADSESEIYDEEECGTDNEEEVKHDMVKCERCGVSTHYSVGECSNNDCKAVFKLSKSGYLVSGEDGNFICDEDEEIDYMSSDDGDEEEDEEVTDDEEEEDTTDSSDEDDMDMIVADEEDEYVYKKDDVAIAPDPTLRRVTRSSARAQIQ